MHTFRLLSMAIEIAKERQIYVERPDREFLLAIKKGNYAYETLLELANEKQAEMEAAFDQSDLPELPNIAKIREVAASLRAQFYNETKLDGKIMDASH